MENTMETVSRQTLSENVNEILDRVSEKHITTLITKDDQPNAVILSYDAYQQLLNEREKRLREVYDRLQTWVAKNSESLEGLDSVKLVRETRKSR
jgi:prevent-host-death family protein